jgi:hypothetical protein
MKKALFSFSLLGLLIPLMGHAHPGHSDSDGYTIIHYFREPIHGIVPLLFIVGIIAYIHMLEQKKRNRQKS